MNEYIIAAILILLLVSSIRGVWLGPLRYFSLLFLVLFLVGYLVINISPRDTLSYRLGGMIFISSLVVGIVVFVYRIWYRIQQIKNEKTH